jgi:glyoxylase-like metal-dependent hydrolase (beta-lactamase superfamily II)
MTPVDGIITVDTEYARPLQDASHLLIEQGRAAFVDTGVSASVPLLLAALERHDIDVAAVDYVFLTHVHLDHAGGAGLLMRQLPNARCVIHPRGAPHMIDPEKVIAGTEAVYGKEVTRTLYGEVLPIPAGRIDIADDGEWFHLAGRALQAFYTEGHARHHYCLYDPASKSVFTGDSFGVSYRELDTAAGAFIFPTTTPVNFDPVEAHKSVDRVLSYEPAQVFLTHYSGVGQPSALGRDLHAGIDDYVEMAVALKDAPNRSEALHSALLNYYVSRLRQHGYAGGRDAIGRLLELDVTLNTKGLEVWLDRQNQGGING